jgi:hypothetical protein
MCFNRVVYYCTIIPKQDNISILSCYLGQIIHMQCMWVLSTPCSTALIINLSTDVEPCFIDKNIMSKCPFCKKSCYQLHTRNYCTTKLKQDSELGLKDSVKVESVHFHVRVGGCDLHIWFSIYRCRIIGFHARMCVSLHMAYIIIDEHTAEVYTHVSYQNSGQN